MNKKEIITAFENLRHFESTDEVEWSKVLADADRAITALKQERTMPCSLTAENGAKSLLSGEFKETVVVCCSEEDGDEEYETDVIVSWDTLKNIYKKIVNHYKG